MNRRFLGLAWCVSSKAPCSPPCFTLVALLDCIRGVCCSLNMGTAQKGRHSLWAAGLTLAGSVACPFPFPPWAELWKISRKISWKDMDSQREVLPCYKVICAVENSTTLAVFSASSPKPPPGLLTLQTYSFFLRPIIHLKFHLTLLLHFLAVKSYITSCLSHEPCDLCPFVAKYASVVELFFMPGVQECISRKESRENPGFVRLFFLVDFNF